MPGSPKEEPEFKFSLGDKVKDKITGFSGVIMRRIPRANNCNTYGLWSLRLRDDGPEDPQNFEEPFLELIEEKTVRPGRSIH